MLNRIFTRLRRQFPVILTALVITAVFVAEAAGYYRWGFLEKLEYFLYDARMLVTMPGGVDDRIVIVDIDEKSLAEVGRWPWSRDRVAHLVNELFDHYHAALVAFDVFFPEPDESSGLRILKALGKNEFADMPAYQKRVDELQDQLDYDQLLARSFKNRLVLLGYYFKSYDLVGQTSNSGVLPTPTFDSTMFKGKNVLPRHATGYGGNLAQLQRAAAGAGHVTPWIDNDGVVRRVPMLYEYQGNYYESLSLAVARTLFGVPRVRPLFADPALARKTGYPDLEALGLDFVHIPVDAHIQALVPYRGFQGSFPYVSAVDVLRGNVPRQQLQDRIVLVGTTAAGLYDQRSVPVQKQYPGVEIHANLIAGILDHDIKQFPAYARGADILQIGAAGLLLALLLPLLSPVWGASATGLLLLAVLGANFWFWQAQNLVLPLAAVLTLIVVLFVLYMSYGFFVERRGKKLIAATFGQYVPPELVDEMNFDPRSYTLEAENREMTVLFSDVRGFTSLSEGLGPGDLSELMNTYLTFMTTLIHNNRGTIDKYIGDAVMAFWGAPVENPGHALCAVRTGMAMQERMHALRKEFHERGWPELHIGVGINTGTMSVGNMGSKFRMAYTVLGDAVNLGSRLEGLTKTYGVGIIVSESTRVQSRDYVYRELDVVRVKGKDRPIAIYEPVALAAEVSAQESEELESYALALQAYLAQDWQQAGTLFTRLREDDPGKLLYRLYLGRIESFRHSPPGPDWDGVFTHSSK